MSTREAKNAFGFVIDTAHSAPLPIERHERGVMVVSAVEEYALMMQGLTGHA